MLVISAGDAARLVAPDHEADGLRHGLLVPPLANKVGILAFYFEEALVDLADEVFDGFDDVEFASSEISQTLRDFLKYLNRLYTFCTNFKARINENLKNVNLSESLFGNRRLGQKQLQQILIANSTCTHFISYTAC